MVGQGGRLQHRVCLAVGAAVERVVVVLLLVQQEGPQRVGPLPQPGEREAVYHRCADLDKAIFYSFVYSFVS